MTVTLRAFTCGWFYAPVSFFIDGGDDTVLRAPIPAYLIEHPKGRALFDTGLALRVRPLAQAEARAGRKTFEFDDGADIGAQLRAAEIDPRSVAWIVNSHLHTDHCGGNEAAPNARVLIQKSELAPARDLSGGPLYDRRDFDTGQPYVQICGEHDLFGDGSVTVFPTFGHTPGHQSMRLRLAGGHVVLAGDCCYLKRSLDLLRASPGDADQAQALATLRRLHELRCTGERIFYGHDGEFWQGVAQGVAQR